MGKDESLPGDLESAGWSQPAEEPKERGCLRAELAPWQAKCVQNTLRREQNVEEALQGEGCVNVGAGEMPGSVLDPKPLLLNLGCTCE